MEQYLLASRASFAPLPATVLPTIAIEGRIPTQQNIHHNTQRPQIAPFVIAARFRAEERVDNFGGHEFGRAYGGEKQWRGEGGVNGGVELDARAQVKVTQLDRGELVRVHTEDVLGLEVTMSDAWGGEKSGDVMQ